MAKAKVKRFQRAIRINGKRIVKWFTSKEAAEHWYNQMYNKKHFQSEGLVLPYGNKVLFGQFVENDWLPNRKKHYPASTYASDLQRLKAYVLPAIGHLQIHKITSVQVRTMLVNLVEERGLATTTRNRVRALISTIFNDALNREEPLIAVNPTFGLKFSSKRIGAKAPSNLQTSKDCLLFLKTAKAMDSRTLVICALGLMAGLRKQEQIALRWSGCDFDSQVLEISEKYIQASKEIVHGTKRGEKSTRIVPIGHSLIEILKKHKSETKFSKDINFVICNEDGSHFSPEQIYWTVKKVCEKANLKVTVHGLRHTFGREFVQNSGNMKALQDILGHSSMSTTEIYSKLGKDRLGFFRDAVNFNLKDDES